jgi:hypothetical protein
MLFRSHHNTLSELTKLARQIDSYQYVQHYHFTNEPIPDVPYFDEYETIPSQSKENQLRISKTIQNYLNRANK